MALQNQCCRMIGRKVDGCGSLDSARRDYGADIMKLLADPVCRFLQV